MPNTLPTGLDKALAWVAAIAAAAPCFYLSWILLNVWREPLTWDDGHWVRLGVGLLVLEFVLLHSGAFMIGMLQQEMPMRRKLQLALGLLAFYSLMVWGFASSLDSPALLWIFAGIIAGRSAGLLFDPAESKKGIMARSAIGVVLYMLVAAGTIFLPIPEWGLTPSVLNEVYPGRGSGLWEAEPERALAGAAVYFLLIGLAEISVLRGGNAASNSNNRQETLDD
jgi:hypothetical protein